MEYRERFKSNSVRAIKNLKLARIRRASDVFSSLRNYDDGFSGGKNSKEPKELLSIGRPKESRPKAKPLKISFEEFRKRWPPDVARTFSKSKRRKLKRHIPKQQWSAFGLYMKSCRRGHAKAVERRSRSAKKRGLRYKTYINSPIWEGVKNRYYQRHPRRCAACNTHKHINLHHIVYGHYGDEADAELIPLCETHHKAYHDRFGTQRNMTRTTEIFVADMRKELLTA